MEANELMDILKNEYGITSGDELDDAISSLGALDITVFRCSVGTEVKEKRDRFSKD